ncbi:MAG: hypothetical protein LCH51_07975 [Bacteroidetes bacterium]|nr:hypothetical protein [Bacteroidota bacterium]
MQKKYRFLAICSICLLLSIASQSGERTEIAEGKLQEQRSSPITKKLPVSIDLPASALLSLLQF